MEIMGSEQGLKLFEDHAFTLPLFTCKFDELTPGESIVLLSQTSVQSTAQPVLFPTPGSFLWKRSYKFHPWFAITTLKKRAQNSWLSPLVTITQCVRLCLSLPKKSCQLCGNVCFYNLEKQLDQTIIYELMTVW